MLKFAKMPFQPPLPPPAPVGPPQPPANMTVSGAVPQAPAPRPKFPTPTMGAGPGAGPAPGTTGIPGVRPPGGFNLGSGNPLAWATNQITSGLDKLAPGLGTTVTTGKVAPALVASATRTQPPLSMFTHHLGDFQGPANGILSFIQRNVQDNPQQFAGLAAGLGGDLTKGLMATPFGLPALTGLYGLLGGGDSFAATHTMFKPLLDRLGIGGFGGASPAALAPVPAQAPSPRPVVR